MARYLISGISGQDGKIAAETLITKGHDVAGISHTLGMDYLASVETPKIWHWDWKSEGDLQAIIEDFKPDFFLNFATAHRSSEYDVNELNSHVSMLDINISGLGIIIRSILRASPKTFLLHASSSQIYTANAPGDIVTERSEKKPTTFYGYSKLSGMNLISYYRDEYMLKAGSAILFNHESQFRNKDFVTRKISKAAAEIKMGKSNNLNLINIGAKADMSSAYDIVRGMLLMCEREKSADYILSSAKDVSILDLVQYAFDFVGLDWKEFVNYNQNKINHYVVGDNRLSMKELGWEPEHTIKDVIKEMVKNDLNLLEQLATSTLGS